VPAKLLHICQQRKQLQLQQHVLQHQHHQCQARNQEPLQHNWQQVQQQCNWQQRATQQTWQQKQLQQTWQQQQQHGYPPARCGKQYRNNRRPQQQQAPAGPVAAARQLWQPF
jgi:hypothetical protein